AKLGGALEGARDAGRAGRRARPEPEPEPAAESREASAEPEGEEREKGKGAPAAAAPAADVGRDTAPEPQKVAASGGADERPPPPRRRVERQRTETVAAEAEPPEETGGRAPVALDAIAGLRLVSRDLTWVKDANQSLRPFSMGSIPSFGFLVVWYPAAH